MSMSCLRIRSSSRSSGPSYTWLTTTEKGDCSASWPRAFKAAATFSAVVFSCAGSGTNGKARGISFAAISCIGAGSTVDPGSVSATGAEGESCSAGKLVSAGELASAIVSSACAVLLSGGASATTTSAGSSQGAASALTSAGCTSTPAGTSVTVAATSGSAGPSTAAASTSASTGSISSSAATTSTACTSAPVSSLNNLVSRLLRGRDSFNYNRLRRGERRGGRSNLSGLLNLSRNLFGMGGRMLSIRYLLLDVQSCSWEVQVPRHLQTGAPGKPAIGLLGADRLRFSRSVQTVQIPSEIRSAQT